MLQLLRTLSLIVIAVVATLFFVQNLASTEVAFLNWSVSAPRAVVFALIFLLGLAMGALLVSLRPKKKPRLDRTPPTEMAAPIPTPLDAAK